MDSFKVILARQAERDLNSIAAYISKHASPATAERFGNQLIDKALTLANMLNAAELSLNYGRPTFERSSFAVIGLCIGFVPIWCK
jgi:plasmid stabilization system protein ParE